MLSPNAGGVQEANVVKRTQDAVEVAIDEHNPRLWQPGMEEAIAAELYKVAQVSPCSIKPAQASSGKHLRNASKLCMLACCPKFMKVILTTVGNA